MKFLSKKIPLGEGLAILFIVASGVYSLGYKIAMDKFNNLVSYTQEKQKMYGNLSEIDYIIRNEYIGKIEEDKLLEEIYIGYLNGVDDINCKFFKRNDYFKYLEEKNNQPSEVFAEKIDGSIGYIRLRALGKNSGEELISVIDSFRSQEVKNIVIDLRHLCGGIIEEAFKILKYLAPEGDLVYTVSKNGEEKVACSSETPKVDVNIAVIVDNYSCGSAEVLAMGLKDSVNAKIIGEVTEGSVSREKMVEIDEDSIMVFPDAVYVTSKKEDFYGKGLMPDYLVKIDDKKEILLKQNKLPYIEDDQLQTAIKVINE